MENTTDSETSAVFDEEKSEIFPQLSRAEEVIVWAAIVIGILGVSAILLRLIMPLIRQKYRKSREGKKSNAALSEKSGQLLESSTPSSSSRASTLSRASYYNVKQKPADTVTISTISGKEEATKTSLNGSLRLPMYLPPGKAYEGSQHLSTAATQTQLNNNLSSLLLVPPPHYRFQTLNLDGNYRNNWDRTFNPYTPLPNSLNLSPLVHPSECSPEMQTTGRVYQPVTASPRSRQSEVKTHL